MSEQEKQNIHAAGVHWIYSPEEWRQFRLWLKRKAGWWPLLVHLLPKFRRPEIPEVLMVPGHLHIGNEMHSIGPGGKRLKRVQILEAGEQNVLCLTCETEKGMDASHDIQVLVPRGKLREAVALENYWTETLLTDPPDWLRSAPPHPVP